MMAKKLFCSVIASSLFSISAFAADIDSSKSMMQNFLKDSYSSVSTRWYNSSDADKNRWQVRATLGSSLFDEKLNVEAQFGVNKKNSSTMVQDRGTRLILTHNTYEGENYSLKPWAQVWFPATSTQGHLVLLGVTNILNYNMDTDVANCEFYLNHDASAALSSKAQVATIKDGKVSYTTTPTTSDRKLTLAGDATTVAQKSPTLEHALELGMNIDPSMLENISFTMYGEMAQTLTPQIKWEGETNSATNVTYPSSATGLPKYDVKSTYTAGAKVNYTLTDDVAMALTGTFSNKKDNKTPYTVIGSMTVGLF